MNRRAVLVLGAGGFIGRQLTHALANKGVRVLAATRTPVEFCSSLVTNIVAPFSEAKSFIPLLEDCDAVIHASSVTTPGSSFATPQIDGNLKPTLALIEALQNATHCRLIYISSAGTVYGERSTPAVESDMIRPHSYHGAGKAAAEQFIHAWTAQYKGTSIVIRPTNVYGPEQTARSGFAIVPNAMDCAASGSHLRIWGDGEQVRDYLHVADLVKLCLLVLDHPLSSGHHLFNASSGDPITLNDLICQIEFASNKAIKRVYEESRTSDIKSVIVNADAARRIFGWQPKIPLQRGLEETWEWRKSQEWSCR